jgi:hypothetical protein
MRKNLEEVPEGTVLAADVVDSLGAVLLKGGTPLTAEAKRRFQERGITHLSVTEQCSSEEREARLQKLREDLDHMFAPHAGRPLMEGLLRAAVKVRLGQAETLPDGS